MSGDWQGPLPELPPRWSPDQPAAVDTYESLPPLQALVMEVLAARARLGESGWTFAARHRPALKELQRRGLVGWTHASAPRSCLAWLTEEGRKAVLSDGYRSPAMRLVEEALHICVNGERAPGGDENWGDWGCKAEAMVRAQHPGGDGPGSVRP